MPVDASKIPSFDEVMGNNTSLSKPSKNIPSFNEVMGSQKKSEVGNASNNGSQNQTNNSASGVQNTSPSQLPSQSASVDEKRYNELWGKANVTTGLSSLENNEMISLSKKLGKPYTPDNEPSQSVGGNNFLGNPFKPQVQDVSTVHHDIGIKGNETPFDSSLKQQHDVDVAKKQATTNMAINKTAKQRLQSEGKPITPQGMNDAVNDITNDVNDGKLSVVNNDDGTKSLHTSAGFWEGVSNNVGNFLNNVKHMPELVYAKATGDNKSLSEIAEQMAQEKEYINNHPFASVGDLMTPSSTIPLGTLAAVTKDEDINKLNYKTNLGSLGQMAGGIGTTLLPLLIPGGEAVEGADAATATLGRQIAQNAPRMLAASAQTYVNNVPENFSNLYQQNKQDLMANGMDEEQAKLAAAHKSSTDALVEGILPSLAQGAFFSGAFHGAGSSANSFGDAALSTLKNSAKFSAIMGAQQGAEDLIKHWQGYKTNTLDDMGEAMKSGFLQTMAMELLPHALSLPTNLKNQLYNYATKNISEPILEQHLQNIPNGAKITESINSFKEALNKIPQDVPDDKQAEIAPLIQQKKALTEEMNSKDNSFQDGYKQKLAAIDDQIQSVIQRPTSEEIADQRAKGLLPELQGKEKEDNTPTYLLSRHGDTVKDEQAKVSGTDMNPLSTDGKKDAESLAADVQKHSEETGQPVTKVVSSDLERAKETAQTIADKTGATVAHDEGLRTWDIGEFNDTKDGEFKKVQKYFVEHPDDTVYKPDVKTEEGEKPEDKDPMYGKKIGETFNDYVNRTIEAHKKYEGEPASTMLIDHSNNMMVMDAYRKNGNTWDEKAAQDYLKSEKPEPATLQNKIKEKNTEQKLTTTFKTSKGSEYTVHEDGTTTRNKSFHQEHGGDEGVKPRSSKTVYVTKDDLNKLDLVQSTPANDNEHFTIAHMKDGKIGVGIVTDDGQGNHGKVVPRTIVEPSTNPAKGLHPVETWEGHLQPHFGNEITEINENKPKSNSENKQIQLPTEEASQPKEEPNKNVQQGEGSENEGIKKAVNIPDRGERKLQPIALQKLGEDAEVLAKGKADVDSRRIEPREVVDRVIKNNDGIYTPDEAGAMHYYGHQLRAEERSLTDEINSHKEGSPERLEAVGKMQQLSDEIDRKSQADRVNSRSWGNLGNVMQIETDHEFNPSTTRTIIKENYGGEIPKEVQAKLDEALKQRGAAIEALRKAKEQMATDAIKKDVGIEERTSKRKQTKDELKKERADIINEIKKSIKKDLGNLNSGIPIPTETLKSIGKLAVNYFKDGVVTIEGLTDKIYNDLKDSVEGLSKKAIREAISNYEQLRETAKNKEAARLQKKETDVTKQAETGELKKQPQKSNIVFKKTNEMLKAEARIASAEHKIRAMKEDSFNAQKTKFQRTQDWILRWERRLLLSNPSVVSKLASAATIGSAVARIPREAMGYIFSKAFSDLADKAPVEGNPNAKALGAYYRDFFDLKKFIQNSKDISKTGSTTLTKQLDPKFFKHYPIYDFLSGDLHSIVKDPAKRAAYAAAQSKYFAQAERQGLDVNDPLVQYAINTKAYKVGQYEIFQNKNSVSEKFDKILADEKKKGGSGYIASSVARFLIPVQSVPLNIASRAALSITGLARGLGNTIKVYRNGIENLPEADAEKIMRQLKYGSVGNALLVTGIMLYANKSANGLYNNDLSKGEKKQGFDKMNLGRVNVPHAVQHALPLQLLQLGATGARIYEHYSHDKKEPNWESFLNAVTGTAGAEAEQIPIVSEPVEAIGALKDPYERKKFETDLGRRVGVDKGEFVGEKLGLLKADKKHK